MKLLLICIITVLSLSLKAQVKVEKVVFSDSTHLILTVRDAQSFRMTHEQKVALIWDLNSNKIFKMSLKNKVFDTAQYCPVGTILLTDRNEPGILKWDKYSFKTQ